VQLDFINTGLKTMAMLFIVLGFMILILYLVKKFILPKRKAQGDMLIKVLSTLHLSPKERIEVIEISGEKIVLGVTPGSISLLTKLSDIKQDHRAIDGS
jgi:flagellar protein FliO/FliZ